MTDDQGWGQTGYYGHPVLKTPNLDVMAENGLRLDRFYAGAPVCSRTRGSVLTGRGHHRSGVPSHGYALRLQEKTIAQALKAEGYATGHFGKWHMGGQRDVAYAPAIASYGFERSLTNFEGMGPKLLPLTMQPGWDRPGRIWQPAIRLGGPVIWMQRSQPVMLLKRQLKLQRPELNTQKLNLVIPKSNHHLTA